MTPNLRIHAISQGHLHIWETCQRKYQYKYLEELSLPEADPRKQASLLLGSNFHLLMQQLDLGLDVSVLAESDRQLQGWLDAFNRSPPQMIAGDRLCEHYRTWEICCPRPPVLPDSEQLPDLDLNDHEDRDQAYFVLTAIYDLLILGEQQAQILDWKTHQRAIAKSELEGHWQTRLYLYLLAQTTNYLPEQLSMTYWFANTAESVVINYTTADRDRTETDLRNILTAIAQAQEYPQVDLGSDKCKYCEFHDRCDRPQRQSLDIMPNANSKADLADLTVLNDLDIWANMQNIAAIPEVSL